MATNPLAATSGATWIFQANPSLYEIETSLASREVIYWRTPQHRASINVGDRVLLWRSGKEAGLVGWGTVLHSPARFDVALDDDPYWSGPAAQQAGDYFTPLRVWPAAEPIRKAEVAMILPDHLIVVAPMGTVFKVSPEDLMKLAPLLASHGFDLDRVPNGGMSFQALPMLEEGGDPPVSDQATETEAPSVIVPAMFLLSLSPQEPIEVTVEGDSLRIALLQRENRKVLQPEWDAVGVYLLLGPPSDSTAVLRIYLGRALALRQRITSGHDTKEWWTRCLLVQRPSIHPFNASDISWLERRLHDVLLEAPEVELENKAVPPEESIPPYRAKILERTVEAVLGVLGALGAYVG
jgi:hypothetical protein